jgi:hypothetical protein
MNLIVMLLFIFVHFTNPVSAVPLKPCEALLAAQPIDLTPQPFYPIEMGAAGMLITPDTLIPALESGFYVYLITANGELLIAPKYHPTHTPRGLATHKSLMEMYKLQSHGAELPDFVAAGEFQIAFDEAVEIRNKSGNLRGDEQSLALAAEVLPLHGLPVTPRTKITPVIPGLAEDLGHTPNDRDQDTFRLQILTDLYASVRGRILIDIYKRMYSLARETFPKLHGRELIEKLMDTQAAGAGFSGDYNGYQTFYYPLQTAFSADGLEYGIWASEILPDHGGNDGFGTGVPKQVKNFVLGAQDGMSVRLRTKWDRLAREFAKLQSL